MRFNRPYGAQRIGPESPRMARRGGISGPFSSLCIGANRKTAMLGVDQELWDADRPVPRVMTAPVSP